jgi:phosphatidylserine decarboxylase
VPVLLSLLKSIRAFLVPVHRDGLKFLLPAAALAILFLLLWPPLGWLFVLVALYIAYFFRDPDRVTPLRDGLVIAPADGRISSIEEIAPPPELGLGTERRLRISIFLSVFDVHINRAPVPGRIKRSIYVPGLFLNADLDKASVENERRALVIEMPNGTEIAVVQIAGLIARRIVTFAGEGESLGVGQRFGLIRFGSRVVLADLASEEPEREARRS